MSDKHEEVALECDPAALCAIDDFCEALAIERNLSAHTLRNYRIDLMDYARWAHRSQLDITTVTHRQLRRYLGELDQAQYARSTVNRRLSSLRSFYRWLNVCGRATNDPASVLRGPKQPKSLPHVIRPRDMAKLLAVHLDHNLQGAPQERTLADVRDQAILEFMYACGARISEVSNLETANIDFVHGQVKVFGKGSKERIIPLHDMAVRSMNEYMTYARSQLLDGKQCPYFFVSTRGNQMSTDALRKMFKATVRAAGLDDTLSPHAMRHTFATDVLNGGADLRSVQEMLGHASLSTTQIYTHLSPARLKEVHKQAHPRG